MAHASAEAGRVGPNAIIRVAETLRDVLGEDTTRLIFARAHLEPHLAHPPTGMVPEEDVGALQTALFGGLEESEAKTIAFEAGLRTGDYLLANRIPKPAQAVLKVLPSSLASRICSAQSRSTPGPSPGLATSASQTGIRSLFRSRDARSAAGAMPTTRNATITPELSSASLKSSSAATFSSGK